LKERFRIFREKESWKVGWLFFFYFPIMVEKLMMI